MDETELFKFISEQGSKEIGIFAAILGGMFWAYKKINFFEILITRIWTEKIYEKYNLSISLVYEKRTTYKFFATQFKKDSQDLFNTLKAIYDIESVTNIHSKTLNFRLEEISEGHSFYSQVIRFLDYYKTRNGVKINIFLHSTEGLETTSNNIKSSIQKYILDSKIHAVKIISGKYKD